MSSNGQHATTLHWAGKLLSAEDVRTQVNGHREIIVSRVTIVTPLAADDLRARGVRILRGDVPKAESRKPIAGWGFAQDRPNATVQSAMQVMAREGMLFKELTSNDEPCSGPWAKALAECVARGECHGGVVFCHDPGLVCCVGNKLQGLRAASVNSVAQTAKAVLTLGVNLVAVEMPGRTFFELRQILRTLCTAAGGCPAALAGTLQELERHAHR
jgi:hypothetical protein